MAAARAQQLLSKARTALAPTLEVAEKTAVQQYEKVMSANAKYVVKEEPATLLKQSVFTSLSRVPAGIAHCKEEAAVVKQKWGQLRELPTTEVAIYAGFVAELYAWFCLGEIVGRGGSLTGYNV
eukprot:scaffold6.g2848.t1